MRKITTKAVTAKASPPLALPGQPVTIAKPPAGITRTAATIAAARTAFGHLSDRDNIYLAFFAKHAKQRGGSVTLAQLATCGERPNTTSNKPHDAGVAVRLGKAGLIAYDNVNQRITFKPAAATHAAVAKA